MRRLLAVVALAGCGRLQFEERTDAHGARDGRDACVWTPFSTPVALAGEVNAGSVDATAGVAALGGTYLVFYSYRTGSLGSDLWYATRATTADAFGTPVRIVELATASDEKYPAPTEDAMDMVFVDASTSVYQLVETTRPPDGTWNAPVRRSELSTSGGEQSPWVSADGLRILFISGRGSTANHIYEATRASRGAAFDAPVAHAELDSVGGEDSPTLSSDGLEIFFVMKPSGSKHVFTARRGAIGEPFGLPQPVPELTSTMEDLFVHLSVDDSTVYVNYNVGTGGGPLSVATRSCQ